MRETGEPQYDNTEVAALLNKKTFPKGRAQHLRERSGITYMDTGSVGEWTSTNVRIRVLQFMQNVSGMITMRVEFLSISRHGIGMTELKARPA